MTHKFKPERTNGGAYFCDCSCGWTGGVYLNRSDARYAHDIHADGGEPSGAIKPTFLIPATTEGEGMSDDELLETYRAAVNKAMSEAHARDGFASNMSRESIVAGLRAVRAEAVSRANSDAGWALNIDRQGGA